MLIIKESDQVIRNFRLDELSKLYIYNMYEIDIFNLCMYN